MAKKNITMTLQDTTEKKLDELVDFFQQSSITRVTRTDVFRYLVDTAHKEVVEGGKTIQQVLKFEE